MSFQEEIDSICVDKTHGSTILLNALINVFIKHKPSVKSIHRAFFELKNIDKSMQVIHHFLDSVEPFLDTDFFEAVKNYQQKWSLLPETIADKLAEKLPDGRVTLLLHSHSGMVIQVLKILKDHKTDLDAIQTHSYPGGEGEIQAQQLRSLHFKTELIDDDHIDQYIPPVFAAFLGVDQYDDTCFVNKTGSNAIVRLCSKAGKAIFLATDPRKKVTKASANSRLFELIKIQPNIHLLG